MPITDEDTIAGSSLASIQGQLFKAALQPSCMVLREPDISLGRRLGEGGFCQVFDLAKIEAHNVGLLVDSRSMTTATTMSSVGSVDDARSSNSHNSLSGIEASSRTMFVNKMKDNVESGHYVVKRPKDNLPNELEMYKAVADIKIEAQVLMKLSHRNIITVRGISEGITEKLPSWKSYYRERQSGDRERLSSQRFFLVMDRLSEILTQRLSLWKRRMKKQSSDKTNSACHIFTRFCRSSAETEKEITISQRNRLDLERIYVALNIARAIQYLHKQQIVYRDLKPDNIGFDSNGVLKLFDFGLAKQIHSGLKKNDLYSLTGNTGSLRYMAPEVARKLPYDYRVDSYSFGLLFWQICSLSIPFQSFTIEMHSELVIHKGHRPELDNLWPITWRDLMKRCWHSNTYRRPEFDEIVEILRKEVDTLIVMNK